MKPVQVYLGVPQKNVLTVHEVQPGQQLTIKQIIFSNAEETDSKITVTVNTTDIMKNVTIKGGETKILDLAIVLNQGDRLHLQQEKINAINVMINGVVDPAAPMY
ncbi:hypothetical protein [Bacillus cereus]|uniref:hypothetical protein n=1 Tax=Bacillus cereus TaxID=1396 RepID=UPI000BEB4DEB|nr:hypothetical protein [Bacillus cereus]PDY76959.1 hypothetical protein CON06_27730 [Bacillus cereus]